VFAAFGLVPEAALEVEETFHLWPDNVVAFNLWLSVQTQWRTDNGMRTGLDYAGLQVCIEHMPGRRRSTRRDYFQAIQAMERAALEEWFQKS
jgi:hypothetical protein